MKSLFDEVWFDEIWFDESGLRRTENGDGSSGYQPRGNE
jgi:hypothetical protein